nr:immunoglobulin heavy chain junction region [Macaca mulatta]MOV86640.1 immunoglobulin heavy chain junction region [Macaca mulatta]MOV86642.1 immunoglobulin heavy chain junction region [Macaca mulatta]MOV86668.1 immunoglobulin heavy chain junction region [Macaca mulatta]MOV86734.1 immunoglobulin heavy chain junction region [Macaca mulatta]
CAREEWSGYCFDFW